MRKKVSRIIKVDTESFFFARQFATFQSSKTVDGGCQAVHLIPENEKNFKEDLLPTVL